MPGNHVTQKHKFVDTIFRGIVKIYSCCLKGVDIKSSNKNVKIKLILKYSVLFMKRKLYSLLHSLLAGVTGS